MKLTLLCPEPPLRGGFLPLTRISVPAAQSTQVSASGPSPFWLRPAPGGLTAAGLGGLVQKVSLTQFRKSTPGLSIAKGQA